MDCQSRLKKRNNDVIKRYAKYIKTTCYFTEHVVFVFIYTLQKPYYNL